MKRKNVTKRLKALLSIVLCIAMLLPPLQSFAMEGESTGTSVQSGAGDETGGTRSSETNLLKNGNFTDVVEGISTVADGKADGWTYWWDAENGGQEASSTVGNDGITINPVDMVTTTGSTPYRLTVNQTVTASKAGTYVFSGTLKVDKVTYGEVNLFYTLGSNSKVKFTSFTANTDGWVTFEKEIQVPSDNTKIKIELEVSNGANLTTTANNFVLKVKEDTELLKNGTFADNDGDNKADGWTYYKGSLEYADSVIGNDGITITGSSGKRLTLYKEKIALNAGTYVFSGRLKVDNVSNGEVNLLYTLSGGTTIKFASFTAATDGWVTFEKEIEVLSDGTQIKVEFQVTPDAELTVTANNFALKEKENTGLLTNGTFADVVDGVSFEADKKADGWIYSNLDETNTVLGKDGITVNTGTAGKGGTLKQEEIALKAGKYVFSGRVNLSNWTSGYINIVYKLGTSTVKVVTLKAQAPGWLTFEKEIEVTADTNIAIEIQVSNHQNISVTLNDFSLKKVGEVEEEQEQVLVFNSGFLNNGAFLDVKNNETNEENADGLADGWIYSTLNETNTVLGKDGITVNTGTEGKGGTLKQEKIALKAGKYVFSGRVNLSNWTSGYINIVYKLGTSTVKVVTLKAQAPGWLTFEKEIEVTADTNIAIEIQVSNHQNISVTFNNFLLKKVGEIEETPVFDSGLLNNGAFLDEKNNVTDADGADRLADGWNYENNTATTTLSNGVLHTEAKGNRLKLSQKVSLESGVYELSGKINISEFSAGALKITAFNNVTLKSWDKATTNDFVEFTAELELKNKGEVPITIWVGTSDTTTITVDFKELKLVRTGDFKQESLIKNGNFTSATDGKANNWEYYKIATYEEFASVLGADGGITITPAGNGAMRGVTIKQTIIGLDEEETYVFKGTPYVKYRGNGTVTVQVINNDTKETVYDKVINAKSSSEGSDAFSDEINGVKNITVEVVVSEGSAMELYLKNFSLVSKTEPAEELLVNGTFATDSKNNANGEAEKDGIADGWTYVYTEDGKTPETVGSSVQYTSAGLQIKPNSQRRNLTLHQTADVEGGENYHFSGKYTLVTNGENPFKRNVTIRYSWINSAGTTIVKSIEVVKHTTAVGSELEFSDVIQAPSDAAKVKFEIVLEENSNYQLTLNDFSCEQMADDETVVVADNKPIIKNPEFVNANMWNIKSWSYSPADILAKGYTADVADGVFTVTGNEAETNVTLYNKVTEIQKDTIYTLTAKLKTTELTGKASIQVRLNDGLAVVKSSPSYTGTTAGEKEDGWVTVSYDFVVPSSYYANYSDATGTEVTSFKVELLVAAIKDGSKVTPVTGSASFKDVVVTVKENIANPDNVGTADISLIANGGFERIYDGLPRWWNVWESTGGLSVTLDKEKVHSGEYSLHIKNVKEGETSRGSVHQLFVDIPEDLQGQSIKIVQWVRTENYDGNGLSIRIQYPKTSIELTSKYIDVKATQDWTRYEYILDLPSSDLKQIKLEYLYDEGKGDIWIDDVEVTTYIKATSIKVDKNDFIFTNTNSASIGAVAQGKKIGDTVSKPTDGTLKYYSSNENVATVDEEGIITPKGNGNAKITIVHKDGAMKEVGVLVSIPDNIFIYKEEIGVVETSPNKSTSVTLPAGYEYKVLAKPQNGAFVNVFGNYIYFPDKDFVGTETTTLLVTNSEEKQTLVVVNLKVGVENVLPEFESFLILTNKDEPTSGSMIASDYETSLEQLEFTINTDANTTTGADGKIIVDTEQIITSCTTTAGGKLTLNGNTYSYVPKAGYSGYDEVTLTVIDGHKGTATLTVTIYVAPSVEEILAEVQNNTNGKHSYLLVNDAKFEELRGYLHGTQKDANIVKWFNDVVDTVAPLLEKKEDGAYKKDPQKYDLPDGVRLDTTGSKDVLNLAFMYRMTKDIDGYTDKNGYTSADYLARAWVELENLCNPKKYINWHPAHLLDVAMTASGVAIAYDWLYDDLDGTQKAFVEAALYKNAVLEGEFQYEDNHMFVTNGFNWNYVCNGGFAIASYALATSNLKDPETGIAYSQKAGEVLQEVYRSIQYGLPQYAPEGDSIEGVSYWDYGTRYLVTFLACVSSATGNNPFLGTPGIYETSLFPIFMTGKAGAFNWSDNDAADAVGYLNSWFATTYATLAEEAIKKLDSNAADYETQKAALDEQKNTALSYAWYHKYYMDNASHKASIYDILYYDPVAYGTDENPPVTPPLDGSYTAQAVTTMREDYTNPLSSFVGFKGGIAGAPHGDLDVGSFIYDLYGIRWATDLGKENYNMLGYWELNAEGTRWGYYRKDAVGHNTLVINPEDRTNQTIGTTAQIIEQVLNNLGGGYTILDMTGIYQKNAADVKRGLAYINRTQVLIRDEYILKAEESDVYWQMHTVVSKTEYVKDSNGKETSEKKVTDLKTIEISKDGKTVTITDIGTGKAIELRIVHEACTDANCTNNAKCADCKAYDSLSFAVMDAVYYHTDTCHVKEDGTCDVEKHYKDDSALLEGAATGSAERIEKDRTDYKKIYIKAEKTQVGSISVLVTPVGMDTPEIYELDQWDTYYQGEHKVQKVEATEATYETEGNMEHYKCTDEKCGKLFEDALATRETTAESVKIPVLTHKWKYMVDDNVITVHCENDICTYKDGITLTIQADSVQYQDGMTYTGAELVNAEQFFSVLGLNTSEYEIEYYSDEECTQSVVPSSVGIYYAAIKVAGVTAKEQFEIYAQEATPEIKFTSASLYLQENISVNYKVKVDEALADKYQRFYVEILFNGKTTVISDYTVQADGKYVFEFAGVAPQWIGDTIYATLYAVAKDDTVEKLDYREYSVVTYCYNMLKNYSSDQYAELRTLMVDLLNYGSAAQIYAGYKTDDLANSELTDEQKAWATANEAVSNLTSVTNPEYETIENPTVSWKGAALRLENAVTVRLKLEADSIEGLKVEVKAANRTWYIDAEEFKNTGTEGEYYVYFSGLNAAQMSETIYATVYKDSEAVSNTVSYSIESYVVAKKNDSDAKLVDMLDKMIKYGYSTYSYAH